MTSTVGDSVESKTWNPDDKFEIEKIVKVEMFAEGLYYFVKWSGYSEAENTWVYENAFVGESVLLKAFKREHSQEINALRKKHEFQKICGVKINKFGDLLFGVQMTGFKQKSWLKEDEIVSEIEKTALKKYKKENSGKIKVLKKSHKTANDKKKNSKAQKNDRKENQKRGRNKRVHSSQDTEEDDREMSEDLQIEAKPASPVENKEAEEPMVEDLVERNEESHKTPLKKKKKDNKEIAKGRKQIQKRRARKARGQIHTPDDTHEEHSSRQGPEDVEDVEIEVENSNRMENEDTEQPMIEHDNEVNVEMTNDVADSTAPRIVQPTFENLPEMNMELSFDPSDIPLASEHIAENEIVISDDDDSDSIIETSSSSSSDETASDADISEDQTDPQEDEPMIEESEMVNKSLPLDRKFNTMKNERKQIQKRGRNARERVHIADDEEHGHASEEIQNEVNTLNPTEDEEVEQPMIENMAEIEVESSNSSSSTSGSPKQTLRSILEKMTEMDDEVSGDSPDSNPTVDKVAQPPLEDLDEINVQSYNGYLDSPDAIVEDPIDTTSGEITDNYEVVIDQELEINAPASDETVRNEDVIDLTNEQIDGPDDHTMNEELEMIVEVAASSPPPPPSPTPSVEFLRTIPAPFKHRELHSRVLQNPATLVPPTPELQNPDLQILEPENPEGQNIELMDAEPHDEQVQDAQQQRSEQLNLQEEEGSEEEPLSSFHEHVGRMNEPSTSRAGLSTDSDSPSRRPLLVVEEEPNAPPDLCAAFYMCPDALNGKNILHQYAYGDQQFNGKDKGIGFIVGATRKQILYQQDCDGNTPLHAAAITGKVELIKLLVDLGSPVDDVLNGEGHTPLECAYKHDKEKCVLALLYVGAKFDFLPALPKKEGSAVDKALESFKQKLLEFIDNRESPIGGELKRLVTYPINDGNKMEFKFLCSKEELETKEFFLNMEHCGTEGGQKIFVKAFVNKQEIKSIRSGFFKLSGLKEENSIQVTINEINETGQFLVAQIYAKDRPETEE